MLYRIWEIESRLKMNREVLFQYVLNNYGVDRKYIFAKYPLFCIFRHTDNHKWFAAAMDIPRNKLGMEGKEPLDVVNLKCDPILIGSLRNGTGIFPAYHMNKENWISVSLDDSVPDDQFKMLLEMSYNATASKTKKKSPLD